MIMQHRLGTCYSRATGCRNRYPRKWSTGESKIAGFRERYRTIVDQEFHAGEYPFAVYSRPATARGSAAKYSDSMRLRIAASPWTASNLAPYARKKSRYG